MEIHFFWSWKIIVEKEWSPCSNEDRVPRSGLCVAIVGSVVVLVGLMTVASLSQ